MRNCFLFQTKRAFTLIELLVVIAIIGLLSSIVLTSLNTARIKGQHAQTISEVDQIKSALQQVADDNGGHPISTSDILVCLGATSCWGGTATNNATLDAAIAKYMKVPPVNQSNPSAAGGYFVYKSPGGYSAYDTSGNPTSNITGTSNSYALIWVPATIPINTSPNPSTDCQAEDATFGAWDFSGVPAQHGAGGTIYRQCGVLVEQ